MESFLHKTILCCSLTSTRREISSLAATYFSRQTLYQKGRYLEFIAFLILIPILLYVFAKNQFGDGLYNQPHKEQQSKDNEPS